jgi:hypothetical protein
MDDHQLWCSCRDRVEIRASLATHASQDSGRLYNAELRITKNDQLIVPEVFCDERNLHARSMQLFEKLVSVTERGQTGDGSSTRRN